jgi:hypothetical protein
MGRGGCPKPPRSRLGKSPAPPPMSMTTASIATGYGR